MPNPVLMDFQEALIKKHVDVPFTLIGDDMGLGKTVEAIEIDRRKRLLHAKAFKEKHKGKPLTLVAAPKSVMGSWVKHYGVWAPHLKVYVINTKKREEFLNAVMHGVADVYVCHWEALRLIPDLQNVLWFHVIGDEIHRIKNRKAQTSVNLKKLWTEHKLGLSGTPADNRPDDLWSVLNWLWPRRFSAFWPFRNEHLLIKHHNEGPCEAVDCETATGGYKYHKRAFDEIMGTANVDVLMAQIEDFYTRRLKEDVWDEMPEKYFTDVYVDLEPGQRRAYEEMRQKMLAWVGKHEDEPVAAPIVVAQLMRLQQFAGAYARIDRIKKRIKDCESCGTIRWQDCQGHYKDVLKLNEPSSKLDAVMDIIMDNPTKQIGVFSNSKQMINMLAARLEKEKVTSSIYTGDVSNYAARDELVERFQQGERRIFAATIRAGGEGITLTAAHTGIMIDRDWSPSKNKQVHDRFHRIGQTNAVQIINIVANDTIEPDRDKHIELKWSWLREILGDTTR